MSGFLPSDYSGASPARHGGTIAQTHFSFPVLKSADILKCFSEMDIEFSKAELTEPHRYRERIRQVFWQMLEHCFGITEEELMKQLPSPEKLGELVEYPELHEDHMIDVLFFRELASCMRVVGIHDFSWKDLYQPTAKRFRCQMSAFINLAKFKIEQLRKYEELMEPRNELVSALQEVHNEQELLIDQLQKTQQESSVKMEEIDAVMRECNELESEIAKSNKLQASKREEAAALKREVNDLKDQLASVNWALQEAEAEAEQLRGQIVSSPSRRKRELADRQEELEMEKDAGRMLDEDIQHRNAEKERFQHHIKALKDLISLQKQLLEDAIKYKKALKEMGETEKQIAEHRVQIEEVDERADEAERNLMRAEEKLQQARKQAKMQMDAAHDRLEIAKEQLLMVEKERQEAMARINEGETEVKHIQEQMKAEQLETEQEIASLIAEYKETEQAFLMRHEKRMQFIEAALS